jgi:adenylate cyclase class 2
MQWEVEQKFAITEPAKVAAEFSALGIQFGPPAKQVDDYFNHPARDFKVTDEALRLRQVGSENFITYKGPRVDATTKTRKEIELPIGSGAEQFNRFGELLQALGFKRAGTVKKQRRSASLAWNGHEIQIAWDDVEGLGQFVELEIAADENTLPAAKQAIQTLADHLNLASGERRSYLELQLDNH